MSISTFLGWAIATLAAIIVFLVTTKLFSKNKPLNNYPEWHYVYIVALLLLSIGALKTTHAYIYPDGKHFAVFSDFGDTLTNADYHVLQHKGFLIPDKLYLANGSTSQHQGFYRNALWDQTEGQLMADTAGLIVNEFAKPLFVKGEKEGKTVYELKNRMIDVDVRDGLVITQGDNDTLFTLTIQHVNPSKITRKITSVDSLKKEHYIFTSTYYNNGTRYSGESSFDGLIYQGYPLLDIVQSTPEIEVDHRLAALLNNSYLVREAIVMKGGTINYDKTISQKLVFFPDMSLLLDDYIQINGRPYSLPATDTIPINDSIQFYAGIGKQQTDIYILKRDSNQLRLNYSFPHKKRLRSKSGGAFITSSLDAIVKDMRDGGYLFNYFSLDDHFFHINANLRYRLGTPLDSIRFEVFDLQNSGDNKKVIVNSDEEFLLASRSYHNETQNELYWVFDVTNLRETNKTSMSVIGRFVLIFFLLVLLRVATDNFFNLRSITAFELSIYVVILAFCTIRLIVNWRISTFLPIDDITEPVYAKLRNSMANLAWTRIVYIVPVLMTLYSLYKRFYVEINGYCASIGKKVKASKFGRYCSKIWKKTKQSNSWQRILKIWVVIKKTASWIYNHIHFSRFLDILQKDHSQAGLTCLMTLLLMILCIPIGKIPIAERFCNIPFPIFIYLYYNLLLSYHTRQTGKSTFIYRVLNFFILFAYIFVRDAGFTIILAIYGLMQCGLNVLFYQKKRDNNILAHIGQSLISMGFAIFAFFILRFEGDAMIFIFEHIRIFAQIALGGMAIAAIGLAINGFKAHIKIRSIIGVGFAIFAIVALMDTFRGDSFIVNYANSKAHMRYRAEIQKLPKDEKIDTLIITKEFNSDDITFIMRSALNQWFINQYAAAGNKLSETGKTFKLQPHSSQGCTYTTQTTDLVITRYVLAEHGERVIIKLLVLLLLLILIYALEIKISDITNLTSAGALILLYSIAWLVYLSATNRIVFVGQDFPFLSIQSKVSVFIPLMLFAIPLFRITNMKLQSEKDDDLTETKLKILVLAAILGSLTTLSITAIEQKGKEQQASQFNVSTIIANISEKVEYINNRFEAYQQHNRTSKKKPEQIWKEFIESAEYGGIYQSFINDKSEKGIFFSSLLQHFQEKVINKNNPSELLHLRRRGRICSLAVNKKHYFIPEILKDEHSWTGDIYAAHIDENFALYGLNEKSTSQINNSNDYSIRLLPNHLQRKVANTTLAFFNSSWVDSDEPLILVQSQRTTGIPQYFIIENDTMLLETGKNGIANQLATAVHKGDVISIFAKQSGKPNAEPIYHKQLNKNAQHYLAHNIWLNGKRRLFYPLGRESMWSYHLANLVSGTFSKSELQQYRDSSMHLSLDYDLHEEVARLVNNEIKDRRTKFDAKTKKILDDFNSMDTLRQRNPRNSYIYFDETDNKVKFTKTAKYDASLNKAIVAINKKYQEYKYESLFPLSDALDDVLEGPYDFTAVAIDGNGYIRLMYDYSRKRDVDPNNFSHLNKVISELYTQGTNQDERDIFGNKALMHIPAGPGSSFKPVAYTATTSQIKLDWNTLNVTGTGMSEALSETNTSTSNVSQYICYGGVEINPRRHGIKSLNIGGGSGSLYANNYLIHSNNLYHSVIILLGIQDRGKVTDVLHNLPADQPNKLKFPVLSFGKSSKCFNPEVWFMDDMVQIPDNGGIMGISLTKNFHIALNNLEYRDTLHLNYFGQQKMMRDLYENSSSTQGWTFPERGSQNLQDRRISPSLRSGFNQMLLGAYPLEQSALEMATNAYRLASLNKACHVTSLVEDTTAAPFEPFEVEGGWQLNEYVKFMSQQVWKQMGKVPTEGTAARGSRQVGLTDFARKIHTLSKGKYPYGRPFYLYCKTGTLNLNETSAKRAKHLLVIITDTPLERIETIEQLRQVKFYTVFLSYIGVTGIDAKQYEKFLEATMQSQTFQSYMNPKIDND